MTKERGKKRMMVEVVGEESSDPDLQQDGEDRAMEDAARDFAEGERVIKLYRYPGELGGRPRLLGGLAREDFNDVLIQERFGGGRYFGRWRKKDGTYTRYNFEIEGDPKVLTRAEEERQRQGGRTDGQPYSFLGGGEQEEGSGDADRGISTADLLRLMAEVRRESRDEMKMLLEMMRPATQPTDATDKVFSLVEKIVPLIQSGGDGAGSNPWLYALSQLKEPLMKMVDTIHTAVTKAPAVPPQNPSGASVTTDKRIPPPAQPTPEPAAPAPEPKSEDEMLVESFRPYLGLLMKAASDGKDPGLYCDLILDQIPVFAYDRLRTWLLKPGCLDDLAKLDATIYAQRVWWEALRETLLNALNEELGNAPRNLQPVPHSNPSDVGPADSA